MQDVASPIQHLMSRHPRQLPAQRSVPNPRTAPPARHHRHALSGRLRLVFNPRGDLLTAARDCEADVFLRWYGNTRAQLAAEYGPYECDSVFVALVDEKGEALACARLLTGSSGSLKTIDDLNGAPWSLDGSRSAAAAGVHLPSTWEVATMGVRPGVQHGHVRLAFALYHGIASTIRANRVSAIVAILDHRVSWLLGSIGIDMRPFPGAGPAPYLGSHSSTPVYACTGTTLDRQRRDFPDAHRLVTLGVGLDGILVPPRDHFRLAQAAQPAQTPVSMSNGLAGAGSLR